MKGHFIKNWKKKLSLFLVVFLVLGTAPLPDGMGEGVFSWLHQGLNATKSLIGNTINKVFASDAYDYFLEGSGYKIDLSGEGNPKEIDLTDVSGIILSLKSKPKVGTGTVSVSGAVIQFTNAGQNVCEATATTGSGGTSGITLDKRGAGCEQVAGTITITSGGNHYNYNFNFLVKSDVRIHKEQIVTFHSDVPGYVNQIFSNETELVNNLLLPEVNKKYQVRIAGYNSLLPGPNPNGLFDHKGHFDWSITSKGIDFERIATVDNTTGEITPVGAGYAELEVSPKHNVNKKAKSATSRIFVPLKLSVQNVIDGNYSAFQALTNGEEVSPLPGEHTSRIIYTNAFDPEDLEWEITQNGKKTTKDGVKIADFVELLPLNKKTANSASAIRINIKRAGKYEVSAKLKKVEGQIGGLKPAKANFVFNVPLIKKNLFQYLNVGDEYNIYNNSNIGDLSDYSFEAIKGAEFIKIDHKTGVVTAKKTGDVEILVNGPSDNDFKVEFSIIDTLSINQSSVTIPIGGEVDLSAISTDVVNTDAWTWESESEAIATVDGKGVSATVKGASVGETLIWVSHTTRGGVTKKASCKVIVTAGVTSIKLIPNEDVVDVDKVVSIRAIVTPETSQGTYLYWRSSNPKIVEIDNPNEHSAVNSVTAKAPGVAVIMALNKDNVVLGSCTITVRTPVKEIKLSQKVLEKSLEEKTHQLTAVVLPEGATETALKWTSTKPEVAIVDDKGLVTFKKPGNTTIICASASDANVMDTCDVNVIMGVSGLSLDKTELSIAVGETYNLVATIKPDNASNKNIIFSSLNTKIASVSNTGLITGRAPGTAYIMVSTLDKKFNATCVVKVTQKPTGFKLSASSLVLDVGDDYALEATFNPKTVTDIKITWSSSDNSVAKVDAKGRVVGVGAGQCVINATTSNSLNAVCFVKVNKPVKSISIDPSDVEISVGEELELEVNFDSDEVTNKDVRWKSSNPSIVTVDKKGVIKGVSGGLAVITVTSEENGLSATSIVTVNEEVLEITLNKTSLNLGYRQRYKLVATIKNKSASKKKIKWSSDNKKIVTVSKSGVIYGKKVGYATIKARATDGSGAEATCRVRVIRKANSLSVNTSFVSMIVGKTYKLKTKIGPKNATIKTPRYRSENQEIAIVDNKGKITAIGAGNTKVTVSAKDNPKLKQVVIVRVREYIPATGITLSNTNLTMGVGDRQSIVYSLAPNGTDDKVTWSSNNKASVRVNKNGVIQAVAPGSSVVSATTSSGKTANVSVTVVGLNFYRLTLEQYDTYALSVLGDVKNISWDTSNHSVAIVSNGTVMAKKAGTCNIYARVNGALLTCKVTVTNIR